MQETLTCDTNGHQRTAITHTYWSTYYIIWSRELKEPCQYPRSGKPCTRHAGHWQAAGQAGWLGYLASVSQQRRPCPLTHGSHSPRGTSGNQSLGLVDHVDREEPGDRPSGSMTRLIGSCSSSSLGGDRGFRLLDVAIKTPFLLA